MGYGDCRHFGSPSESRVNHLGPQRGLQFLMAVRPASRLPAWFTGHRGFLTRLLGRSRDGVAFCGPAQKGEGREGRGSNGQCESGFVVFSGLGRRHIRHLRAVRLGRAEEPPDTLRSRATPARFHMVDLLGIRDRVRVEHRVRVVRGLALLRGLELAAQAVGRGQITNRVIVGTRE